MRLKLIISLALLFKFEYSCYAEILAYAQTNFYQTHTESISIYYVAPTAYPKTFTKVVEIGINLDNLLQVEYGFTYGYISWRSYHRYRDIEIIAISNDTIKVYIKSVDVWLMKDFYLNNDSRAIAWNILLELFKLPL